MSTKDKDFDFNGWNEFTVSKKQSYSAVSLYESYKIFKERFKSLPKSKLIKLGWIDAADDITHQTDFYNNVLGERNNILFRKSNTADAALFSLWLSKVKSLAQIKVITNSVPSFNGISKNELKHIAKLSVDIDVIQQLPDILKEMGIVLIYNKALPSMKLDGVVLKLESGNPVIGLSFRFPRLDHFWFTLMHELAHIHLHMNLLDCPILEDLEIDSESEIEVAANRLAKNSFVDRVIWRNCEPKYDKGLEAIEKFADEINIHKSIVAGMLRKETGNFRTYSNIVNEVNVRELVFGND